MRVLERIVEAHGVRVVARPLDVAAEVAFKPDAELPGAGAAFTTNQEPAVFPAGIQDFAIRAVVVLRVAAVQREQHAALTETLLIVPSPR